MKNNKRQVLLCAQMLFYWKNNYQGRLFCCARMGKSENEGN